MIHGLHRNLWSKNVIHAGRWMTFYMFVNYKLINTHVLRRHIFVVVFNFNWYICYGIGVIDKFDVEEKTCKQYNDQPTLPLSWRHHLSKKVFNKNDMFGFFFILMIFFYRLKFFFILIIFLQIKIHLNWLLSFHRLPVSGTRGQLSGFWFDNKHKN